MKRFLLAFMLFCGAAHAETTGNLINNTWNNVVTGSHPNNCCSGGPSPLYDPNTNTIHFSYGLTAVHQVRAINQALSGTGIVINGWNWGYDLRNMNGNIGVQNGTDSIAVTSFITNSSGQIVQQSDQHYNTRFDWSRFEGTVSLNTPLTNYGSLGIQFVSKDDGFWAGYYGPQVRNVNLSANYTVDQCSANPLSSPDCPGYAAAYFTQQCTANPLYDPTCPGYHTMQCSINPLYAASCPGYQQAYFNQQCTLNALYDVGCPGYAAAYLDYQCSLDALYSTTCSGYEQAYFNQQCSLDGLYNNQCPNYSEAFALKNIVNKPVNVAVVTSTETVAVVSDPIVNEAITSTATSASPAAAATATVPLVAPAPAATTVAAAPASEEKKDDSKNSTSETGSTNSTASSSSDKKEQPKTARQQLAERRQAAAKAAALEKAKNADKELESATSMAAQVAVQNVVIQAMGYTPGFEVYNVRMPDGVGYKPFTVYDNQKNVDNARLMRGLTGGSDRVHAEMVDSQYRR